MKIVEKLDIIKKKNIYKEEMFLIKYCKKFF